MEALSFERVDTPPRASGLWMRFLCLSLVMGSVLPTPSMAQGEWSYPSDPAGTGDPLEMMAWAVVPDHELADQRGGLIQRGGFELALGIERTTAINGEVVARTVLMDPSGTGMNAAPGSLRIRNTLDGVSVHALSGPGWNTVVQNQLNHQVISNQTILNVDMAGVNFNRMEMRRMLDAQMVQGLRGY